MEIELSRFSRELTAVLEKQNLTYEKDLGEGGFGIVEKQGDTEGKKYAIKSKKPNDQFRPVDSDMYIQEEIDREKYLSEYIKSKLNECGYSNSFLMRFDYVQDTYEGKKVNYFKSVALEGDLEFVTRKGKKERKRTELATVINDMLTVICQMIWAIYCLHKINVIHGDIKLPNFLINEKNQIKITDYGGSAINNGEPSNKYKQIAITTPYIIPPNLMKNHPSDPISKYSQEDDVYALGITILHYIHLILKPKINFFDELERRGILSNDIRWG